MHVFHDLLQDVSLEEEIQGCMQRPDQEDCC